MAGLFPSIANSQNVDRNGVPLEGSVLSVFTGGTTTLASCYQDIGLAIVAQNPMTADETGRLPIFYVADGVYRVRLVDQYGVSVYDYPQLASIGASSSGGGGTAVDATTVFQTGYPLWLPIAGSQTGFVRMNGLTIGSATSGAGERANSDCQPLFLYAWANFADALCPVVGGRGISAAADWAANKKITTLDMRMRGPFGVVDMGNTALTGFDSLTFTSGNKTTGGSTLGAATKILGATEVPNHGHPGSTSPATALPSIAPPTGASPDSADGNTAPTFLVQRHSNFQQIQIPSMALTIAPTTGGGQAFDKMSPGMLGTWFWKL